VPPLKLRRRENERRVRRCQGLSGDRESRVDPAYLRGHAGVGWWCGLPAIECLMTADGRLVSRAKSSSHGNALAAGSGSGQHRGYFGLQQLLQSLNRIQDNLVDLERLEAPASHLKGADRDGLGHGAAEPDIATEFCIDTAPADKDAVRCGDGEVDIRIEGGLSLSTRVRLLVKRDAGSRGLCRVDMLGAGERLRGDRDAVWHGDVERDDIDAPGNTWTLGEGARKFE
jgi:hypothetical protein